MQVIGSNLATAYVLSISYNTLNDQMKESNLKAKDGDFSMVDELHHFSAGIKNTATTYSYFGIDELRQACGGAGFLLSSKIADIWSDWSPTVTFEGTNVVMAQQSARYVLK